MCFKCPFKHCFKQPVLLGAKHFQAISWKAYSLQQALTRHLCHSRDDGHCITNPLPNDWGCTPAPMDRTGYYSKVSMPLENSFQAIPLAPTKFSGQFSQSTDDWSKQASPTMTVQRPLLWERSGADYKGPHWYKRERGIPEQFRHWWGPKGLCSATFK